jgi:hypothetical protein
MASDIIEGPRFTRGEAESVVVGGEFSIVRDSSGVGEESPDRDPGPGSQLRKPARGRVVEGQPLLFLEDQGQRGGERLRDAVDQEERLLRD